MAKEIERKFLVKQPYVFSGLEGERILQGYVAKEIYGMTTRVRIRANRAFLTLKGPVTVAEIELSEEGQSVCLPEWIGEEVTGDPRFGNFSLAMLDGSPESKWWIGEFGDQSTVENCCCGFSASISCCHMKKKQTSGDR